MNMFDFDLFSTSAHSDRIERKVITKSELHDIKKQSTPWIEKYRPRRIDDIVLDTHVMTEIKNIIEKKDMPNIILTGLPGTGKTTTIGCIAYGLYGKYYKTAVLELNASDDRGIKSVQNDVATFCNSLLVYRDEDKNKYSRHKLIILDEADNITEKAQHLISNMIEKYHNTTRFAFTCNTSSDIIESIQSRCRILRYVRLDPEKISQRLTFIADREGVEYDDNGMIEIASISQGDLRNAINILQLAYNRYGTINVDSVNSVCENPSSVILKDIMQHCIEKNFKYAVTHTLELKGKGYSGSDIILGMIRTLKLPICVNMDESEKIKLLSVICESAYNISKGVDTDIQLVGCIADMCKN